MVEPDDLEAVEPGPSRTIEIEDFVALEEIDPVYYEKPYYLAPTAKSGAEHSYQLLREAMHRSERVGIARFVMRGKQYLAAVRPRGDVLVLETLYFHDEVRDPKQAITDLPGEGTGQPARARHRAAAHRVAHHDVEARALRGHVPRARARHDQAQGQGQEIMAPEREHEGAEVVDLMEALRESLDRGGRKSPSRRTASSRTKKSSRTTKSARATKSSQHAALGARRRADDRHPVRPRRPHRRAVRARPVGVFIATRDADGEGAARGRAE